MTSSFERLGALVVGNRRLVVLLWLVAVALAIVPASRVQDALTSGGIEVPGSESDRGARLLEDELDLRTTRSVVAVFASGEMVADHPRFAVAVLKALGAVREVQGVGSAVSVYDSGLERLVSADRHVTYAIVNVDVGEDAARELVPAIREALEASSAPLDSARLAGFPAFGHDVSEGSARDLRRAEAISLPIVLVLLLVVFGSAVAAALPVALGATSVLVALALLRLVSLQVETTIFAMNTASMIGLGLSVDFALLLVSRHREELASGLAPEAATVRAVATAGRSIVFSGLTVAVGLSVMLLCGLGLVRSVALGMLLVALVGVAAAVTLLPALLALLGRHVDALRVLPSRRSPSGTGRWHAWSRAVMRRPWLFALLSLVVLLGLALPAARLDAFGVGGLRGVGRDAPSRQALETLAAAFPAGEVAPVSIVVKAPAAGGAVEPRVLAGTWRLTRELESDERVSRVESLATLRPGATREDFVAGGAAALASGPLQAALVARHLNVGGASDVQLVDVVTTTGETDARTSDFVRRVRDEIVPGISELDGCEVLVTGQTALNLDYRDALYGRLPLLVGLVLLATYAALLVFFRSAVLPLKAIGMNVVSILASYGVLVAVFQWGLLDGLTGFEHAGRLSVFPPVLLFFILFGLSTDYEVFLLSRVKELHDAGADDDRAVGEGLERTAGLITAAAAIMIVVFGAFALGDVLVVKELGVGLAVAVFLDATLIRVVLVPASMKLLGHVNWWLPFSRRAPAAEI